MKYYKYNYKYQLAEDLEYKLPLNVENISHEYFYIKDNVVTVKNGYAWDGASGPTIDTKNTLEPSLIHDVLYQAMRLELLDQSYKEIADRIFYEHLLQKGMTSFRAWYWYQGVKMFGSNSCTPQKLSGKEIIEIA